MELSENDKLLIKKYIDNNLTTEERKTFEENASMDQNFIDELLIQVNILQYSREIDNRQFEKRLQPIVKDAIRQQKHRRQRKIISFTTFSTAVAAILIISFIVFNPIQRDYLQLFTENFEPYDDVITDRGNMASEYDTMFYRIMTEYYNKGNYDTSNLLFNSLYSMDKPNDLLLFYYGLSSLAAGDNIKAIQLLKEINTDYKDSYFYKYKQSRWYLALAYLNAAANSKGKKQEEMLLNSKNVLQGIIDNNSDYAEKARMLLSKY